MVLLGTYLQSWDYTKCALNVEIIFILPFFSSLFLQRHPFYVEKVIQGEKICENKCVIEAKKVDEYYWLFVAVNEEKNQPRVIFPRAQLEWKSCKRSDKRVSLTIDALEKIVIEIEFCSSTHAKEFYEFVEEPLRN